MKSLQIYQQDIGSEIKRSRYRTKMVIKICFLAPGHIIVLSVPPFHSSEITPTS